MAIIIIGASAFLFLVYLFCYRFYGVDARIQMFVIHVVVLAIIAGLAVVLWFAITNDEGTLAINSALAALTGFSVLTVKFVVAEFLNKKG
ncbi:MAG: hypothetical protein HN368_01565 [Spirochaetales bacterium]|nr:hypothetical protein [Spirochaetales bacterium]